MGLRDRAAGPCSEEPLRLIAIGDEQVFGLLVVVEHHLVVLAADARLLVAAERRMGRVQVVAVGPHPAGLDIAPGPVSGIAVAAPHPGPQPVEGVVGDADPTMATIPNQNTAD